jgi:hypothetical protein
LDPNGPTPYAVKERDRRIRIVNLIRLLVRNGYSGSQAAQLAGTPVASAWRYSQAYANGGLAALLPRNPPRALSALPFAVSKEILLEAERRALRLYSPCGAWRAFARDRKCPADLAEFLRQRLPRLPGPLKAAVRMRRVPATLFIGRHFFSIRLEASRDKRP